jgi:hypothetical protein
MAYYGDKKRLYQNEWVAKRRHDWIESQGGQCAMCGSIDKLEVDHVDPSIKLMYPREIWSRRKEVREAELAKCQVLCFDCHEKKTRIDASHPSPRHGTLNMYDKHGCRCNLCRTKKSLQNKKRYL